MSQNESPIYRNQISVNELFEHTPGVLTLRDFWDKKFNSSADEWFIGKRPFKETPQDMLAKNKKMAKQREDYESTKAGTSEEELENLFPREQEPTLEDKFSFMKTSTVQKKI